MKKRYVVVKRTYFTTETREKVLDLTKQTLPAYRKQSGLIDLKSFISVDNTHVITIITWKDRDSYEKSQQSRALQELRPKWEMLRNYYNALSELDIYQRL